MKRVYQNPLIKDTVTVLKTSKETGGAYTLLEVELAVGGGNGLHYHTTFAEEFTAIEGTLGIELNKKQLFLKPQQKATAQKKEIHRFFNPGKHPIRFQVKLLPGEDRFLQCLAIGYGLAEDGMTNKKGIPKNLNHLAILLELSDTRLTGAISIIHPFLKGMARRACKKGVDKELFSKYWD